MLIPPSIVFYSFILSKLSITSLIKAYLIGVKALTYYKKYTSILAINKTLVSIMHMEIIKFENNKAVSWENLFLTIAKICTLLFISIKSI